MELIRGYVPTNNKKCLMKFKQGNKIMTLEEVSSLPEYAGILGENTVAIDIDDGKQAEKLLDIVDIMQLDCKVIKTTRGMHFYFKNNGRISKCYTGTLLACGFKADIKAGCKNSYVVLKIDGKVRPTEYDVEEGVEYQEVPFWLLPVKSDTNFFGMKEGDGRNQALYNHILSMSKAGLTVEESRESLRIMNEYVLGTPLPENELETIMRDEAFPAEENQFFDKKGCFRHETMGDYLMREMHIAYLQDQLHSYIDGYYQSGKKPIEKRMVQLLPTIRIGQKKETISYIEAMAEEKEVADPSYIGFANCYFNIETMETESFSPDIVIPNRIPWDYNPNARSEIVDKCLDDWTCGDREIRMVLEEMMGYCMYRDNKFSKMFILTGEKANGKSTFIDMLTSFLGDGNCSHLDLKDVGDKFRASMMHNKLANTRSEIGDGYIDDTSGFKGLASGDPVTMEHKGVDAFQCKPYTKLIFSANDMPSFRDRSGAVLRRLVTIPFNATFDQKQRDYDLGMKLRSKEACEYLVLLGIKGLRRLLDNGGFTDGKAIQNELDNFRKTNDPVEAFLDDMKDSNKPIEHESLKEVYRQFGLFFRETGCTRDPISQIRFNREIEKRTGLHSDSRKIEGESVKVWCR